jgi:phenylacetate-CoA ligase
MSQDRAAIEAHQLQALQSLIGLLLDDNPFYSKRLRAAGITAPPDSIAGFTARLPFICKPEIVADQAEHPPYGSNLTYPIEKYTRFNQTSGTTGSPLRWLDTTETWNWMLDGWTRILQSAGVHPGDRIFFPFSFGPFLGFWLAFEAAARLGCLTIPGGGMRSVARLQTILDNRVTVVCATPTYALRLAEVAAEEGFDLTPSAVRVIITAGEPGGSIPATRGLLEKRWPRARVVDHHGMTETGPVSYQCPRRPGVLHIMEAAYFPEVIHPDTLLPVGAGETGELVLTNLGRTGSPLLRYRTNDLVRLAADTACVCGSHELALEGGILGRDDDMLVIRGVNLYPAAVEEVLRSCGGVREFRVEISNDRALPEMAIQIEAEPALGDADHMPHRVESALVKAFGLRIPVSCVPAGTLPRFETKAKRWARR